MATSAESSAGSVFVGRTQELDQVRSVLDRARSGGVGALLVSGDAGVGKTRLIGRACADLTPDVLLMAGACLPLTSTGVPLVPLRAALRRLPADLGPPTLSDPRTWGASSLSAAEALDHWLDDTCRERPVVVVVDDLQWADDTTLDALMYVLAGPSDRQLAVLLTLRRGEVGAAHTLQRWLADIRRMPWFAELRLGPFDRTGTRAQLAGILGTPPHESLVSEVHERSGGNAYLTSLLAEGLAPSARHLGTDLPADLREAVLRPWHRLSHSARALVLAVALGGEVALGRSLARAADLAGIAAEEAPPLLHEAVDEGVLDITTDGGYWFHHPLQAEALEGGLAGDERRRLHAALARACAADLDDEGPPTAERLAATSAVGEHHARAGHDLEAYRWTLRAADLAEELDDRPAQLTLLQRLVGLRGRAEDPAESSVDLLERLRHAAAASGDHETELGAVEALLAALDESQDPLLVCELVVRREHLRFSTGRGFLRVDRARHAVDLSAHAPGAWQHGYALAELAHASLWADDPGASDAAAAALERAQDIGHPRALAYAGAAGAMALAFARRPGGSELAATAAEAAVEVADWWAFVHATLWEANGTGAWGTVEWASVARRRREQMVAEGAPHPYLAWLSADEGGGLLGAGDWRGCVERLRVALGSDPGAAADVAARLTAARLAVLQGRQREAEDHLARADELFAETSGFLADAFDAVRAEVRLGAGDAEGAYEAALVGATSPGVPPTRCEWLCPLAARALADVAEAAREEGRPAEPALERLAELVDRFPHVIEDTAFVSAAYGTQLEALDALYAAEVGRALGTADASVRWGRAAELLDGVWPWDAAYATYRAGEAVLLRGGASRDEASALLRRAAALATELGAEPVLREVVELARSARVSLDAVRPAASRPRDARLPGLTAREREVLQHVVAGRTYGEIARALFVSEKTVSSHISNLLRKTGASNRVELARLARHATASPPG